MTTAKFKLGDQVKVIAPSYVDLAKSSDREIVDYLRAYPQKSDEFVLLGGTYTILSIQQQSNGKFFYKLLEKSMPTAENFLQLYSKVTLCPYRVGDEVVFTPQCSPQELQGIRSILHHAQLDEPGSRHKIIHVLNDYYIYIDFEPADPWSFPFRWIDFTRSTGSQRSGGFNSQVQSTWHD